MKKILLLATGGTIASQQGGQGLAPRLGSSELLRYLNGLQGDYAFEHEDILNLDSSNIQPEHWRIIARRVFDALAQYDGILITHGTDTMAYTASALGFMLQNLDKSIVLTGSQVPIGKPLTDAGTNLYTAVSAIESGIKGVTVAFNRKIINGTRTVKVSTMGFDAFESVNASYMGQIFADGMRVHQTRTAPFDASAPARLLDKLCSDVFLLKLLPGTKPELFDAVAGLGYRGIVLEAFGAGGLHYIHRDLLSKLQTIADAGIVVVVCSQCLYERSDLSIYQVGQRLLGQGVLPGGDMTTEAAATKLMWALGQTADVDEIKKIFATSYAGEITL